ncbi:DNA ligase 1 [Gossypium hirsutum]|uniref:DNA ligase 1 n=1 Tax=Gossypium hirsutum TaxID=3635 RepID=A0A1U8MFI1_GOSHI|nr:DNA ligase 1-like [Gossypium hirsutum]
MAYWSKNDGVPFSFLFRAFDFTTQRVCRNDVNVACNMLRTVMRTTPRDLLAVFHLLANKIAPKHELASDLGVGSVFKALLAIAKECRRKNKRKKLDLVEELVMAAGTLGQAAVYNENRNLEPLDSPEAAEIVKRVHSICLVYDKLIWAILDDGISKLSSSCSFSIGVPVEPMLAKLSLAESEIIERFNGLAYVCKV